MDSVTVPNITGLCRYFVRSENPDIHKVTLCYECYAQHAHTVSTSKGLTIESLIIEAMRDALNGVQWEAFTMRCSLCDTLLVTVTIPE